MNKLARSTTKWTKTCDKRLKRLISYIHHTCEYQQYCYVGNTAKQCRLGLFQDSDFTGDLEDSKSTSGGTLCVSGSHTFVPTSWMCKKQTSVSHSSTESAFFPSFHNQSRPPLACLYVFCFAASRMRKVQTHSHVLRSSATTACFLYSTPTKLLASSSCRMITWAGAEQCRCLSSRSCSRSQRQYLGG